MTPDLAARRAAALARVPLYTDDEFDAGLDEETVHDCLRDAFDSLPLDALATIDIVAHRSGRTFADVIGSAFEFLLLHSEREEQLDEAVITAANQWADDTESAR